jgi:hypothetical protein
VTNVALSCTAPVVGAVSGVTATVSETPDLPATDQWGDTYAVTPSVSAFIPPALIGLAQQFGQTALEIDTVSPQLTSSGFTADPGQSPVANDTQTVTVDSNTLANGATVNFTYNPISWTTTTGTPQTDTITLNNFSFGLFADSVQVSCTTAGELLDSVTVHAPVPEPPVISPATTTATVSNGQCVTLNLLANDASAQNNTVDPTSVSIVTQPLNGAVTVDPVTGAMQYCTNSADNPSSLTSDSFQWNVKATQPTPPATSPVASNTATVNISINFLTCQATSAPCSLNQLLLLPLQPGPITLEQSSSLPVDTFGTCSLPPGEVQITGQAQVACSAINPLTVLNQTGLDTGWTLTGQTTDFVDPADAQNPALNNCTTQAYNNHCIPGGNLGWNPISAVGHDIVPGDTAQVTSGPDIAVPSPVSAAVSSNPLFEGAKVQPNPVLEPSPSAGLRNGPKPLCFTASGQSGGTFVCGGELQLAVPASVANSAAPGYEATLTLTLTL